MRPCGFLICNNIICKPKAAHTEELYQSKAMFRDELLIPLAKHSRVRALCHVRVTESMCACAAVVATGLRIRPALLVVEPTAAAGVAFGGLVVRPCLFPSSNALHAIAAEGDAYRWRTVL